MATPAPGSEAEPLSDAERQLMKAAAAGEFLALRPGSINQDESAATQTWTDEQAIRAEVLARLLTETLQPASRPLRYVKLRGARITGSLNLAGATLTCPLWLQDCLIEEPINLDEATAPAIRMPGCHLPSLRADQLRTDRDLILNEGFTASGEIVLQGARVGGQLDLSAASVTSLDADMLTVEKGMSCNGGFRARGEVRLYGATVNGQLGFRGAQLANPSGTALGAQGLNVAYDMLCTDGFSVQGRVLLSSARIGHQLSLNGAHLANPGGTALLAQRLTADAMLCQSGFTAEGEVNLLGASIGGQLNFDHARLANPEGWALTAGGVVVGENMTCERLHVDGAVNLTGVHVRGTLNLNGASLAALGRQALVGDMLEVGMGMWCGEGFTADGEVRLLGARIDGQLHFIGASLNNPGGTAVCLEHAQVGTLVLAPVDNIEGTVVLTHCKAGTYFDAPANWPLVLDLRGFTYERLEGPASISDRLDWLARNASGYVPQIYDQLAAAFRQGGNEEAARTVAVAGQRRRRRTLNFAGKLVSLILDWTVGYGYRTWKAAVWLAVLIPLSAWAFTQIRMIPAIHGQGPFNSVGYTFDLLIPIADLGQKNDWQPAGDYVYLTWLLRAIGWILTTAVIAAVTGVLRRD